LLVHYEQNPVNDQISSIGTALQEEESPGSSKKPDQTRTRKENTRCCTLLWK
jgi:hypothetical protein